VSKKIDMIVLGCKLIASVLVAFILSDTGHKLLPYVIGLLLTIVGLKLTKKVWDD
jgi:hypothetical protein|tara:strand:+ start:148 stop:312 length:165 start_codon:yes stop_codon:yes gene_type:complete